jgi:hypothetical protein
VPSAEEDVFRLDVPVHDSLAVRVGKSVGHLYCDRHRRVNRQPPLALEELA